MSRYPLLLDRSTWREKLPSLWGGILTSAFSLIIFGAVLLLYLNLIEVSAAIFGQNQYSLFLRDNLGGKEKRSLEKALRKKKAQNLVKISPEQAREEMLQSFVEAKSILEQAHFKPFPEVWEFSLPPGPQPNPKQLDQLRSLAGVTEVFSGRQTQEELNRYFRIARFVGSVLLLALLASIFILIGNSIQLSIYARFQEIQLATILGATRRFVQVPLLLDGVFIAFSGLALSLLVLYLLYQFTLAGVTFDAPTYAIRAHARFFQLQELALGFFFAFALGAGSAQVAAKKLLNQMNL